MAEQARFMVEGSSYYSPLTAVRVGGACYYPLYDKLGSSRRLIDANQTVTDAYWYDAFGNITSQSGGTYNPYRYVGSLGYYSADTTTGLLHVGARYYSPQVGRFWTQDPLDVESNRYAYVLNDPLLLVDPAGLAAACWNPIIALSDPQCTLHWVFTRETWSEALIQSAYLGCYASCMGIPLSLKSLEELYTRGGGPRLTARALYHFTDRRFVAWGKYSRVLVPRLAGRILPWAEALSGVGSVVIAVESVRCMSKCTRCPR
jgi:RHS repeat-associated protein